jgi:serine/threonine-protein kinase
VLPFTGLREPQGLSVDIGGTVYVADTMHNRILALSAGSNDPAVLPFEGLNSPIGVTADNSGTVYVNDSGNKRVLVLPSGSRKQTQLAFTDLAHPTGPDGRQRAHRLCDRHRQESSGCAGRELE